MKNPVNHDITGFLVESETQKVESGGIESFYTRYFLFTLKPSYSLCLRYLFYICL